MLVYDTKIRVCYADTDQMGVVYFGNYPRFYEIGRGELIRSLGISYADMEKKGIMLPTSSLRINYLKSAYYDDLLTVRTIIDKIPAVKFQIRTEIFNEAGELINKGETVLAFFDRATNKPCKAPTYFTDPLKEAFSDGETLEHREHKRDDDQKDNHHTGNFIEPPQNPQVEFMPKQAHQPGQG